MNEGSSKKPPKRWIGLLLGVTLSGGAGHLYLGLLRRGLLWFGAQVLPIALLALLAVPVGVSLTAYWGMLVWVVLTWLGQIVDLCLLDRSRFLRPPLLRTIGLVVALLAASRGCQLLVRHMAVEAYKTPSGSMAPTLMPGDHVLVDKSAYAFAAPVPSRGEVIVFRYPDPDPDNPAVDFTKRVIGLPGDRVETSNGHPMINGWMVPSCFVANMPLPHDELATQGALHVEFLGQYSYLTWYDESGELGPEGPYIVPPNQVFVFGDNRWNSADSRSWNHGRGGGVPRENVKGTVLSIWLAFGPTSAPTWERIGLALRSDPTFPGAPYEVTTGIERCLSKRPPNTFPPPPGK